MIRIMQVSCERRLFFIYIYYRKIISACNLKAIALTLQNIRRNMKILIINGPNLNLLGRREPEIYGTTSFEDYFSLLKVRFDEVELSYFQTNHEGEIIDKLHSCMGACDAVVLNAGAYSHTSLAIADAIASIDLPVVEVHISNVFARETIRQHSMLSSVCKGLIVGFGLKSYDLAICSLIDICKK